MEQVRRKREPTITSNNRRTNALKHQHSGSGGAHPGTQNHPSVLKDSFSSAKNSGHVNGVNVIGLTQSSASPSNQPMSTSMSTKMAMMTGGNNTTHSLNLSGLYLSRLIFSS